MAASDAALHKLEEMVSRDPFLRDVFAEVLPRQTRGHRFSPDIDVLEVDGGYQILLDVPGVERESLEVTIDGTKLIVAGTKAQRHPDGGKVKVGERGHGAFKREFLLPCAVDPASLRAKLADGVLRVDVPRVLGSQTVKVDVA